MNDEDHKTIQIDCEIFQRTERLIVFGGSYSGKSYFIQQLVLKHHNKFRKIIICGTKNDLLKYPETRSKTVHFDDESNPIYDPFTDNDLLVQNRLDNRQTLIILDDLMCESYNSQVVNKAFSKGRHLNISVILILQSFFPQGNGRSLIPMLKNNTSIQIFFKLRNRGEIEQAARKNECDKKNQKFFLDLIESKVYSKRFGYVAIFMDEGLNGKYRTNLLGEDGSLYETIHIK